MRHSRTTVTFQREVTRRLRSAGLVSEPKNGTGLGEAPITIPPLGLTRKTVGALRRLADAIEAADQTGA